jgi:hypothetical protein
MRGMSLVVSTLTKNGIQKDSSRRREMIMGSKCSHPSSIGYTGERSLRI